MDEATFRARIAQIYRDLDRYNYYELLNLDAKAPLGEIRSAFHRMARTMHPDRFHSHPDAEMRRELYAIYKRLTEGYKVLMDPQKRREYDNGLRRGRLRLLKAERERKGPRPEEEQIRHPQARRFFKLGEDAERRGDTKGARMNYAFALDIISKQRIMYGRRLVTSRLEALDAAEQEARK